MIEEPTNEGQSHSGDNVREELRHDASELGGMAKERAEARAGQEQQRVAKTARSASTAMNTAADQLRDDQDAPEWMASMFTGAARQIDDLAGRLQDKSPRDVARETSQFGRENPAAFLIASAAAGFAAARFLRAGAEQQHQTDSGGSAQDAWRSTQDFSSGAQGYSSATATNQTGGRSWDENSGSAAGSTFGTSGDLP